MPFLYFYRRQRRKQQLLSLLKQLIEMTACAMQIGRREAFSAATNSLQKTFENHYQSKRRIYG
jgi:hypothetical protein